MNTEEPRRVAGVYEILFRLIEDKPAGSLRNLDLRGDYYKVGPALPIPEFPYPVDLMATLIEDPDRFGKLPRHLRRYDVIRLRTRPPHKGKYLMVVDPKLDEDLVKQSAIVHTSREVPLVLLSL